MCRLPGAGDPLLASASVAPAHSAPRTRVWPRRVLIGLNVFIALCLVATASAYGYLRWRYGDIPKLALGEVLRGGGEDDPGEAMNVLLVGSDTRATVSKDEQKKFGSTKDVGEEHSDTMMILRADPKAKRAAILSIPRDLYVDIAGANRKDRINTAIQGNGGVGRLITTIRQELGIPIDHYMQVDFNGFRGIVDAVGGVTIPFEAPARDRVTGLNVPRAGCIELDGEQALAYARSRHFQYFEAGRWHTDPSGDLGRIERQQKFVRRMMKSAIARGVRNPITANSLINAGIKNVTIDDTLSTKDIARLATRFRSLDPEAVETLPLPTVDRVVRGTGAQVLELKEPDWRQVIDRFNGVSAETAPAQLPRVIPGTVRVRVLNGSGRGGQATEAATQLQRAGFVVSGRGDADNFRYTKTVVRYGSGQREKGLVLQAYVEGGATLVEDRTLSGGDLVLVTASSYGGIKSAPPAAGPTTTSSTTPPAPVAKNPKGAAALDC